ncbi:hypothetical protein P170DRAFT_431257 [Aspergillus steynii IBT 23096]|uniref:Phosphoglycerate mutase-like protein n=1 Tax=Aspergillus steynii IBT 23096 TaxID=1392250 RepID=A0A2I2FRP7_9EURO|nr:uncharacterized protein P170DRAFT_431257 [Aspergillus steynii IBT 23096]PLB43304.1 hypothetical protein P170DRAFT_431257 [Aspergillus steynii IBT 23096]
MIRRYQARTKTASLAFVTHGGWLRQLFVFCLAERCNDAGGVDPGSEFGMLSSSRRYHRFVCTSHRLEKVQVCIIDVYSGFNEDIANTQQVLGSLKSRFMQQIRRSISIMKVDFVLPSLLRLS